MTNKDKNILIERLAELEHNQWMAWAKRLMETETLSPERIERWKSCMVPYADLTEEMKEFDREWARKALIVFLQGMAPKQEDSD